MLLVPEASTRPRGNIDVAARNLDLSTGTVLTLGIEVTRVDNSAAAPRAESEAPRPGSCSPWPAPFPSC